MTDVLDAWLMCRITKEDKRKIEQDAERFKFASVSAYVRARLGLDHPDRSGPARKSRQMEELVLMLTNDGSLTDAELSETLGISERTVRAYIAELKEEGEL